MVYIAYMTAMQMSGEHAEDVLARLLAWQRAGEPCALVIVRSTQGGAVRATGALLAVSPDQSIGYISGGCIDADVVLQARQACSEDRARALRYGAGSPFVDLPLPCGGAIEVDILPNPPQDLIQHAHDRLVGRLPMSLFVSPGGDLCRDEDGTANSYYYAPKLRLRIAGRGSDALALAKMSQAAGYETCVQLLDEFDIRDAKAAGLADVQSLTSPAGLAEHQDDPWTAFVLLFHDQDWEIPLLKQVLAGPAFYVGAVGSKRTHEKRCDGLRAAGVSEPDIAKVRGPIGLVPSLRDASFLAISVLSEIIEAFPATTMASRQNTALVLLAAGESSRFEAGDKLLADLNGRKVLEHAAALTVDAEAPKRIAVVPDLASDRASLLWAQGWHVVDNPDFETGQASSVKHGMDQVLNTQDVDQVIVLLGDMPNVPQAHLQALQHAARANNVSAVMSHCDGVLCPPALFKREHFGALMKLQGDRGAKSYFTSLTDGTATVDLGADQAQDIDLVEDLDRLKETAHA